MPKFKFHMIVCTNTGPNGETEGRCSRFSTPEFRNEFKKLIKQHKLSADVRITKASCLGFCAQGPVAVVYPEGYWYTGFTKADAKEIFESHVLNGKPVTRLLMTE